MADYNSTARALALPVGDTERRSQSNSPVFSRRSTSVPRSTRRGNAGGLLAQAAKLQRNAVKTFFGLSPAKRILLSVGAVVAFVLGILFLVFNERIFHAMSPVAERWRNITCGWMILWAATFLVSFPPLIGYSTCVTLAGFVYGVWKGWLIVASGTIIGSTASFLVSRTLLKSYVTRLTENDKRFAALALTLKHDGIKLLMMIRLCPLPYSLSNGAISTIPTVQWPQFMIATAAASPKLFLHVFVGSQLGRIADSGDKMDAKTKAISYLSIAIGLTAGLATGFIMYTKTKSRARELEAEEREAAIRGEAPDGDDFEEEGRYEYSDDAMEREATEAIRGDDGISLRSDQEYRDDFDDDADDAQDLDKVFRHGDGDEEEGFRDSQDRR
ncbi:hypothetical protein D6D01_01850 [Aureobasidium pullulans]|uniref:Golgi apparatus membrane protein TVP38 n=1 Tax=Aureobasidium pullulans TaxID=5580 RepID=A0A4S9LZD7_AURPU|nr:hypothetical protein D6D01_01850 [Aureobasidium pullulans]